MWKTALTAVIAMAAASAVSFSNAGYDHAGKYYLQKMKEERKSIRSGSSTYHYGRPLSGGLHSGK